MLRKTKLHLENKTLQDSKKTQQHVSNLAEAHEKYIDTMKKHKEANKISIKAKVKCKFFSKPKGCKADKCKYDYKNCEIEEQSDCSY